LLKTILEPNPLCHFIPLLRSLKSGKDLCGRRRREGATLAPSSAEICFAVAASTPSNSIAPSVLTVTLAWWKPIIEQRASMRLEKNEPLGVALSLSAPRDVTAICRYRHLLAGFHEKRLRVPPEPFKVCKIVTLGYGPFPLV
jgi:hypothetical protein